MAGKRGERLLGAAAFPLVIALLLLPAMSAAYTLIPGQIHILPAKIQLNYSAAVIIANASLYDTASGLANQSLSGAAFTATDATNTTFLVSITGITPGTYDIVVSKSDGQPPYKNLSDDAIRFTYLPSDAGLNIHLVSPRPLASSAGAHETGFASSSPYTLTFNTTKSAWCKYSTTGQTDPRFMAALSATGTPAAPVLTHRITGLSAPLIDPLLVWCNSTADGEILSVFTVGYETAPPSFSVALQPPTIVDPLAMSVNMSAVPKNGQRMYCEATGEGQTHSLAPAGLDAGDAGAYTYAPWTIITFAEQPAKPVNKSFSVTCTNRAGRSTSNQVKVPISLNYNPVLSLVSPGRYTTQGSPVFAVQVVKAGIPVQSGSCGFTDSTAEQLASADGITYNTTFTGLADGDYTHAVRCVIAGGKSVAGPLTFTVDTQPPPSTGRSLAVPAFVCGDEPLIAYANLSEDMAEDPNFAGYRYNITYTTGTVVLETGSAASASEATLTSSFAIAENKTYVWHVWPADMAGNLGAELTGSSMVVPANDTRCDRDPPAVTLAMDQTSVPTLVSLNCTDAESGCAATFSYDLLAQNATAAECAYSSVGSYGQDIQVFENSTLCYEASDYNGNNATGFVRVPVNGSAPPAASHCGNNRMDADLGEIGVDCGGPCPVGCPAGNNCTENKDCSSYYCNDSKLCETTSCTDGIQDGYETGKDCGGASCPPCAEGMGCASNTDCASGSCEGGLCANGTLQGCSYDSDCGDGMVCQVGQCAQAPPKPCTDSSVCGPGEICGSDGTCQRQQSCTSDTDCSSDGSMVCDAATQACAPAKKAGASLLGLILVILGLLAMGGSGYWLYYLHQERVQEEQERRQPAEQGYAPAQQQEMTPEQRLALLRARQEQLAALRARQEQAAQQRAAAKQAERQGVISSLDGKPAAAGAKAAQGGQEPQPGADEEQADDDFIDLGELREEAAGRGCTAAIALRDAEEGEEGAEGERRLLRPRQGHRGK